MGDTYLSNKDGNRVDPASQDKLEEVRLYLQHILESPGGEGGDSYLYRTQKVTIGADSLGRGQNQPCKSVTVTTAGQTGVKVTVADPGDDKDGDTNGYLISSTMSQEFFVTNCNRLRFYGTSADDIHLLARL